jgi:hypothetical protein
MPRAPPSRTVAGAPGIRDFRRKDLDRHFPAEPRVLSPVHLAHASDAESAENLVGTEPGTLLETHIFPGGSPTRAVTFANRGSDRIGSNIGSALR